MNNIKNINEIIIGQFVYLVTALGKHSKLKTHHVTEIKPDEYDGFVYTTRYSKALGKEVPDSFSAKDYHIVNNYYNNHKAFSRYEDAKVYFDKCKGV